MPIFKGSTACKVGKGRRNDSVVDPGGKGVQDDSLHLGFFHSSLGAGRKLKRVLDDGPQGVAEREHWWA